MAKRQTKLTFSLNVVPDLPRWRDQRLTDVRFNQYAWQAPEITTREAWEERAAWVRKRVLLSAGLLPFPQKTPLNARVWGEFEHQGCRIAKAQFESRPGFLCAGNLYLPPEVKKPAPAILCPHGHWPKGRLHHDNRGSIPARCIMLARLGFVVFAYDMIGYNDSRQVTHRWPTDVLRQAALWGINPLGLQLWNGIRALDFISGLRDVDAERVGCTGASGGGSQTWNLAAVDDRVKAAVPVCMLSSHYQGGCVCEESPLLRLGGLTTLDIVGSLAPRPVLLPSVTGDWTNLNPTFEAPILKAIYRLFDAEDRVANVHFDAGHNYNQATREHVYPWFLRWLAGDSKAPTRLAEPKLKRPPISKLLIFPTGAPEPDDKLTRATIKAIAKHTAAAFEKAPATAAELRRFRRIFAQPYAEALGVCAAPDDVAVRVTGPKGKIRGAAVASRVISRRGVGDVVPALWIVPDKAKTTSPVTLVVHGKGKAALFKKAGPGPLLASLLRAGRRVMAIDILGVGETAKGVKEDPRETDDPVFYAFNPSLLSMKVQDTLTALAALRQHEGARTIDLVGVGEGARVGLLAAPLAGKLESAAFDLKGVRRGPRAWQGHAYHPAILKVGELKTAVALTTPTPLLLSNADHDLAEWARAVYEAM